jgi:hypothetical protein
VASRRTIALLVLVLPLLVLALLAAGCGGGDKRRAAYEDYVSGVNSAQEQFTPGYRSAVAAVRGFGSGSQPGRTAARLQDAASTMRAARASLALLRPPEEARGLHRDFLRLLDLQARLSQELALAAEYVPAVARVLTPPEEAAARLRTAIKDAGGAAQQRAALERYTADLQASIDALDALAPPPVLVPWHQAQAGRLEAGRALAGELASAIAARRPDGVDRALRAYAAAAPDDPALARAQAAAVHAFNGAIRRQQRLYARITREQARISAELAK